MKNDPVLAVCAADVHLSLKPPVARSAERNWLAVQAGYLGQLREVARKHRAPILYAGDVFDKWYGSLTAAPELINFALTHLPSGWAVPGNHDLPHHSYQEKHKSAFYTLVQAGKLKLLDPGISVCVPGPDDRDIVAVGFPHGFGIKPPLRDPKDKRPHVAVVHAYCWIRNCCRPKADKSDRAKHWAKKLDGFDAAAFGDNHKGFVYNGLKVPIMNCGGFALRNSDEKERRPMVGLLRQSMQFEPVYLDTSDDRWLDKERQEELAEWSPDMSELVSELAELGGAASSFFETLTSAITSGKVGKRAGKTLLKAMERLK